MIDYGSKTWINYIDAKVWENLPESSLKSRTSSEINFRCPLCGDSKKNRLKKRGYFYRRTGTFYCFNCQTSLTGYGLLKAICTPDVFDRIVQEYQVLNFNNFVHNRGKVESESSRLAQDFEVLSPGPSYRYLLDSKWTVNPLSESALKYLEGRKVPDEKRGMLKSICDQNGREFVLIQYLLDDECVYHQLDNFNRYDIKGQGAVKYIFPKDENINFQQKPVFNISEVDVSFPYLFCTEGVYDSLFIKNGVALGGRSLTEYQAKMLKSLYPRHRLVMAFDNDYAGMQSTLKHAEKNQELLFLDIGDLLNAANVKDINDFVKATGRDDIFRSEKLLKCRILSAFQVEMKIKLNK